MKSITYIKYIYYHNWSNTVRTKTSLDWETVYLIDPFMRIQSPSPNHPPSQMSSNIEFTAFLAVHYCDVIMGVVASQITSLTIVYSTVYSDADQKKHQSSASLAFVRWIQRGGAVNSPRKWPVTREMFPFYDVIM